MTTSSKWLRRALLGGVALGVAATGAQADELSSLKAQLEALQSRVNQMEASGSTANAPVMPQGASWITFNRGSEGSRLNEYARPQEYIPEDRGYTIAITPSADMPAPVHEVTVSGYVKGDFIYDTYQDLGDTFAISGIGTTGGDREHVRLHARQSRFRIRSRSDTAVGQVRTLIEGDFFGAGGNEIFSNSSPFRLRHAWGEWDITPNTTIGIGQTWTNYMNLFAYADTVDFFGPSGPAFARQAQIRVTYNSGPMQLAFSVENPETQVTSVNTAVATGSCAESLGTNPCEANDNIPDFTGRLQYEAPGGHMFQVSGVVRNLRVDGDVAAAGITGSDSEIAWGILGAASINLADIATLQLIAQYGDGLGRYVINGFAADAVLFGTAASPNLRTVEVFALQAALSFGLTDTTTANVVFGYHDQNASDTVAGMVDDIYTVHANLIWQPVSQFRMGIEGMWGETDFDTGGTEDALRFQFGAWFFF